jgi:cytochrome oxidase Cu insertion factor (SCO1/SenC/PrrC family)
MNNLSGPMITPAPRKSSTFSRALVLAILVSAWPVAATHGHATATEPQQNKASRNSKAYYVCPMHPEVKSTKRGKCPKCKMALRLAPGETGSASSVNPDARLTVNTATAESVTATTIPTGARETYGSMKMVIPDVEVLDQDGNRVHFYRDLIKGKTIAINFIFTTCTTICPPLAATFARVQKEMGEKVGRDIHLISISVDPVTDTPQRLKAWGAKFKAAPGWTFVTGDKQEIDKLLNALGASVGRKEDHSPAAIIGNDLTGEWMRTYGLAKPVQLVELILKLKEGTTGESLTKEPDKR